MKVSAWYRIECGQYVYGTEVTMQQKLERSSSLNMADSIEVVYDKSRVIGICSRNDIPISKATLTTPLDNNGTTSDLAIDNDAETHI